MPSTDLCPSLPLTIPNSKSNSDSASGSQAPSSRFILFDSQWIKLQNYITQGLQLPINKEDWMSKYGDFADKDTVSNCLSAMRDVNNLSNDFGDPSTLKAKIQQNSSYFITKEPPKEIYGNIVWLANQIHNTADTFNYTFLSLKDVLSSGTPEEKAANLKQILVGDGGLVSSADDMKDKTSFLVSKLAGFDTKFSEANNKIITYSGSSSQILTNANQLIGGLSVSIKNTQDSADKAYKLWRDLTISAVTTSVGVMVLSGGLLWFVSAGLGAGLGTAAAIQRANYNDLCKQLKSLEEDKMKKTRLVTDLTGLNSNIALVAPAMTEFKNSLDDIMGVWNNMSMNLAYIANNYGVDQLSNLAWVMQALKIEDAQRKWKDIADTAQQFTQKSLVSYDHSVKFGSEIPDNKIA